MRDSVGQKGSRWPREFRSMSGATCSEIKGNGLWKSFSKLVGRALKTTSWTTKSWMWTRSLM